MKRTCKYLSFGAAAVLIAMMMAATVVERLQGTPVAFQWFYHSPLFDEGGGHHHRDEDRRRAEGQILASSFHSTEMY